MTSDLHPSPLNETALAELIPSIARWAQTFNDPQFANFAAEISIERATLYPLPWARLFTRYETRQVEEQAHAYRRGRTYSERSVDLKNFPVWGYRVDSALERMTRGQVPAATTLGVAHSDLIHGCGSCSGHGSVTCRTCGGASQVTCGGCNGEAILDCRPCSGKGQIKCRKCSGKGEIDCSWCTNGYRSDGRACEHCHRRGFTPCNECQHGFKNCGNCSTQGRVRCGTCDGVGHVNCHGCDGHGRLTCRPCEGSGKLVSSYFITSAQEETDRSSYVFSSEVRKAIPPDVETWVRTALNTNCVDSADDIRLYHAPPAVHGDRVTEAGQGLIDSSHENDHWKSDDETWDLTNGGTATRILHQWYYENYIPLVKVEYSYAGKAYVLWSASPCVNVSDGATGSKNGRRHIRRDTSIYATHSPIHEHVDGLLSQATQKMQSRRLKDAHTLAVSARRTLAGDKEATRLINRIAEIQNRHLAAGAGIATALALGGYTTAVWLDAVVHRPWWYIAIALIASALIASALMTPEKILFQSEKRALGASAVAWGAVIAAFLALGPKVGSPAAQEPVNALASRPLPVAPKASIQTPAPADTAASHPAVALDTAASMPTVSEPPPPATETTEGANTPAQPELSTVASTPAVAPASKPGPGTCSNLACVVYMQDAALTGDTGSIDAALSRIDSLPKKARGNRKAARELNAEGLRALARGDGAAAVTALAAAAKEDEGDIEILSNLGAALVSNRQVAQGMFMLQMALLTDPRRTSTWVPLAEAYEMENRRNDGLGALMLAYRFSSNKAKTIAFFTNKATTEASPAIRALYGQAIEQLRAIDKSVTELTVPAPGGAPQLLDANS